MTDYAGLGLTTDSWVNPVTYPPTTTTTYGGYYCQCGQWVLYGFTHYCPALQWHHQTYPMYSYPTYQAPDPSLARIADALEKLLERLEDGEDRTHKVCEEVCGCNNGGSSGETPDSGRSGIDEEVDAFVALVKRLDLKKSHRD